MHPLIDLIQKIHEKPGIYLGGPSTESLRAFLHGWMHARGDPFNYQLLGAFQDFVQERYHFKDSVGWDKILKLYEPSPQDALDSFFKLFDEFLALRGFDQSSGATFGADESR